MYDEMGLLGRLIPRSGTIESQLRGVHKSSFSCYIQKKG